MKRQENAVNSKRRTMNYKGGGREKEGGNTWEKNKANKFISEST